MKRRNEMNDIVMYESGEGDVRLEVQTDGDTVWLTLDQMSVLFQRDKSTISRHVKNVFAEGELEERAVVAKNATTAADGKTYRVSYYSLDVIISVGYRVKSREGVRFRQWATGILREYLMKGFALDDDRLKGSGGGAYWRELLDRIRDIRSSEKVMYRQVLDLYATAVDYDPRAEESVRFFKVVQNKLHYAAHGHTAAEVIFERANADKEFMGLTAFKGNQVTLADVKVAKNYLSEDELRVLNGIVSGYFDFAEVQAIRHKPLYMSDYVNQLDSLLKAMGEGVLEGAGTRSHAQAMQKAEAEYRKYQERTLSPVEKEYFASLQGEIKAIQKGQADGQD